MGQSKSVKRNKVRAEKKVDKTRPQSESQCVIWMFDNPDVAGKFAFDIHREDFSVETVFEKLLSYSKMTWNEIAKQVHDDGKSKHHYIGDKREKWSDEARERLKAKGLEEEYEAVYSFALTNRLRVIGIRDGRFFHVLWYDPKHEFYPITKK